jgi:hypothetical protein
VEKIEPAVEVSESVEKTVRESVSGRPTTTHGAGPTSDGDAIGLARRFSK